MIDPDCWKKLEEVEEESRRFRVWVFGFFLAVAQLAALVYFIL